MNNHKLEQDEVGRTLKRRQGEVNNMNAREECERREMKHRATAPGVTTKRRR